LKERFAGITVGDPKDAATPGGYVFDADVEHAQQVATRINSCFVDSPSLPFGGAKNSGFGRELAELGIGEFLNRKLVRVAP
jgi:succinate-semialdehyde dehydrogenase/glutarate-semialdehyde dehydrogenase